MASSEEKSKHEPAWMDAENDERIRQEQEAAPLLFGSGDVSLQDPPPGDEKSTKEKKKKKEYGALDTAGSPSDEEEKDDDVEKQKGSSKSAAVLVETPAKKTVKEVDVETLKPHQPGQNACLWMFHLLEGISTAAAICLLMTQILPFFLVKFSEIPQRIGVLSMMLKLYLSLFCVLFILTETSAPIPFLRNSALLQTYLSRGILYSFIGLICVEEAYSERVKDIVSRPEEFHVSWAAIFMEVSSWLMLGTGVLYMLLGMCCLKRVRDRLQQQEKDEWKNYREEMKGWKEKYG